MAKNTTELVLILDRSGSMSGLEGDTIKGFNEMIHTLQKRKSLCYVTTFLFDDKLEFLHDRERLSDFKDITEENYYVRGCTALNDALGTAILHIEGIHKYIRPEDVPAHTIFVLVTDGMENASRKHTTRAIREAISKHKDWRFLFLGADIDSVTSAEPQYGFSEDNISGYECTHEGVAEMYKAIAKAIEETRAGKPQTASWKTNLMKGYEK